MHPLSRIVAMSLLITITAALPGAHAFVLSSAQTSYASGCHGNRPITPNPSPASYQCCASGHNWALLTASFSPHHPIALFLFSNDAGDLFANHPDDSHLQAVAFLCGSPPTVAPLRI